MLKTLIVLPDGTELFSGVGETNAIQSVTITECVNGAQELTLGSCCANMIEAKILTPKGTLSVAAGDELEVYLVADDGTRHKVGLFTTEKPTRPTANSMSITAYDRVSWLDKDLTQWLAQLDQWPYSLHDLASMVCAECGLVLKNEEIPNGEYYVQRFSAEGITGRQLMQWVGEICGRFCRATADGDIEFAWYTPATIALGYPNTNDAKVTYENGVLSIQEKDALVVDEEDGVNITSAYLKVSDDGDGNVVIEIGDALERQYYFQNGLSFEDFAIAPIEKVQLRQNEEDVGTVYPDLAEEANTYIISGNYLLTANTATDLKEVAQTLYEQLAGVSYTPCKVSIPTNLLIHAGNTVQITDRNGKSITAYVMTRTQTGQKDTLECTGSPRRDSSSAVNNQSYKALTGKVLNLITTVEGLKVENSDTAGRVVAVELTVEGLRSEVSEQKTAVTGIQSNITKLEQSSTEIKATVQSIQENGTEKVSNEFGLTINESHVEIHRKNSEMTNRLDENGMYVVRNANTENETVMLQADEKGVIATDVSVHNYLSIGKHARFEDYGEGRTACFWMGED